LTRIHPNKQLKLTGINGSYSTASADQEDVGFCEALELYGRLNPYETSLELYLILFRGTYIK